MSNWKFIPDFEGLYVASSDGLIRSFDRLTDNGKFIQGKMLKQAFDENGYLHVVLSKNEKQFTYRVHQLIAKTFIGESEHIHHINGDKTDNRVENLLPMTCKEHRKQHSIRRTKKVVQYTLDYEYVRTFSSLSEIRKEYGYDTSVIGRVCNGVRPKAYGYIWEYAL